MQQFRLVFVSGLQTSQTMAAPTSQHPAPGDHQSTSSQQSHPEFDVNTKLTVEQPSPTVIGTSPTKSCHPMVLYPSTSIARVSSRECSIKSTEASRPLQPSPRHKTRTTSWISRNGFGETNKNNVRLVLRSRDSAGMFDAHPTPRNLPRRQQSRIMA